MMFFSSSKKNELILILDIQSSIVRGSLVGFSDPAQKPQLFFTCSSVIPFKARTDSSFLVKMTLKALTEAKSSIQRFIHSGGIPEQFGKKINEVHFVLSSPWLISRTKTVRMDFDKNRTLEDKMIYDAINVEKEKMTVSGRGNVDIVEQKIFGIALNGYSVDDWHDKPALQAEVSFVISAAGPKMIERFANAVDDISKRKHVYFHSSLLLQYIAMRRLLPQIENCIMIHVHGELTDITVVGRQGCTFFGSFPVGVRTIVRKLSQHMRSTYENADSQLSLYSKEHIDSSHGKNSISAINDILEGWKKSLKDVTSSASAEVHNASIIVSALAHEDIFKSTLSDVSPKSKIESLDVEEIQSYVDYGPNAERLRLSGLYSMSILDIHDARSSMI